MGERLIVKHRVILVHSGFMLYALCFMLSCNQTKSDHQDTSPKFTQYYNQGELLYATHCSNCHQKNGKGLGRLYPPLDSSDFMTNNFNEVICLMENGKSGSLVVNGVEFNQAMPGVPTLSDLEVAQIATYIYNTWTHRKGMVDVKEVSVILQRCDSLNYE